MEFRHIRTDHQAQKVARALGVCLEHGVKWTASADGRTYWASRPMYALREWLANG